MYDNASQMCLKLDPPDGAEACCGLGSRPLTLVELWKEYSLSTVYSLPTIHSVSTAAVGLQRAVGCMPLF